MAEVTIEERLGRALWTIAESMGQERSTWEWYATAIVDLAGMVGARWVPTVPERVGVVVHVKQAPADNGRVDGLFEYVIEMFGTLCNSGTIVPAAGEHGAVAQINRLRERMESAIARNESLIQQREVERVAGERSRIEAAYGRALLRLVEQLRRLRRASIAGRAPFDMTSRKAMIGAVLRELDEVEAEEPGSLAAADEIIDVLATALQLHIGTGRGDADLLARLMAGGDRLAARLDLVDEGHSWSEAKALVRAAEGDSDGAGMNGPGAG